MLPEISLLGYTGFHGFQVRIWVVFVKQLFFRRVSQSFFFAKEFFHLARLHCSKNPLNGDHVVELERKWFALVILTINVTLLHSYSNKLPWITCHQLHRFILLIDSRRTEPFSIVFLIWDGCAQTHHILTSKSMKKLTLRMIVAVICPLFNHCQGYKPADISANLKIDQMTTLFP